MSSFWVSSGTLSGKWNFFKLYSWEALDGNLPHKRRIRHIHFCFHNDLYRSTLNALDLEAVGYDARQCSLNWVTQSITDFYMVKLAGNETFEVYRSSFKIISIFLSKKHSCSYVSFRFTIRTFLNCALENVLMILTNYYDVYHRLFFYHVFNFYL